MPPVRFRIRTVMIAVVALAVLMRMVRALNGPFFDDMVVFAAAVVLLAAAIVASLVVVIVFLARVVVDLFVFAVYSWRGPTRPRQFTRTANRPFRRPEPGRRGEPERV
jgi:hypothetical protein